MNREAKKCIKYYIDNIKSEKYKEYLTKREEEGLKNHREYIRENKPEWIGRTDYYEPDFISAISFYDVLDNEGTIKLLRKLYSLPKRKYKVRNYYKKPGRIKKYDYIHLKYSGSGWGRFAEIELLDDSYVSNISISWCQLNSYYAFYVYEISFKKLLDEERYYSFMRDTMNLFCRKDYVLWYPSINHIKDDELDGLLLETMDQDYFPIVCQHYITSLLYSEQGRQGPLINMVHQSRKDKIDIEKIYIGDMDFAYYSRKENFSYLQMLSEMRYTRMGFINSIVATIISVVAAIVAILALFG